MMIHIASSPSTADAAGPRPARTASPGQILGGAERQLAEAADRALRRPADKLAIVLHLSALAAPRDYHVRVARVLLQDCAQLHGGQVFAMRNRDLVLLCTAGGADGSADMQLPARLAQLFAADLPDRRHLTSMWRLDRDPAPLLAYLETRRADSAELATMDIGGQPISLAALQEIVAKAPLSGLMVQQTGLSLSPDRGRSLAARLAPAFQAISIGLGGLNLDQMVRHAVGDPYLFRHFSTGLDGRLLKLLHDDLSAHGKLLRPAATQGLPVLIELGLEAIASPAFAAFARLATGSGLRLWVAVALLQASASLALLDHARRLLSLAGCRLVINRIDPAALPLIRPAALQADVMILPWSSLLCSAVSGPSGLHGPGAGRATRLVLTDVDGERALAWGQAHGIELFAGPYLDQVQTALRMQSCHSAAGCTLSQCNMRAAALGPPRRSFCANPALLAAGLGTAA